MLYRLLWTHGGGHLTRNRRVPAGSDLRGGIGASNYTFAEATYTQSLMGSTFELPYQQVQDIFADGTIQTE